MTISKMNYASMQPGVCTSSTRPPSPYAGMMIYETDTNFTLIYNGVEWKPVKDFTYPNLGNGGLVTQSLRTSAVGGITTTQVDLGQTVTWTAVAGRTYLVEAEAYLQSTVGGDSAVLYLTDASNAQQQSALIPIPVANVPYKTKLSLLVTGTGSLTLKLRSIRNAGSGTVTADAGAAYPAILTVTDITPPTPYITVPRWELTNSATQAVANGTPTAITWNTETADVGGCHTGSNAIITAPVSGMYQCSFNVRFESNAAGVRGTWMERSSTSTRYGYTENPGSGGLVATTGSALIYLDGGETLRVYAYQNSGASLNYTDIGAYLNHFSGMLVSPPAPSNAPTYRVGGGAPAGTGINGEEYWDTTNKRLYQSDGTGWIIMAEPTQTYTPGFPGITLGSGTVTGTSHRSDGWCDFTALFTLGAGSAYAAGVTCLLPYASAGTRIGQLQVSFEDSGAAISPGVCDAVAAGSDAVLLYASLTNTTYQNISGTSTTIPFTFGSGDKVHVSGRFQMNTRYL